MLFLASLLVLLSIFLDGIISNTFTYFSSNFLLLSLLLIFPLFLKNKGAYLLLLLGSTIFYDSMYTNILFLNTITIFCIYLLMEKNRKFVEVTYFIGYFLLYHLIVFSSLYTVGYIKDPFLFIEIIFKSSVLNLLYATLLYNLLKKYYPKKKWRYQTYSKK